MICPNCNKENKENAKFCSSCGFALDVTTSQPPEVEVNDKSPEEKEKISKTAKTLTIISICLRSLSIFSTIIGISLYLIFDNLVNCFFQFPGILIWGFVGLLCLASIILIIIAQVKVSVNKIKSKFVKGIFVTQLVLLFINSVIMACFLIYASTTMVCEALNCSDCFR